MKKTLMTLLAVASVLTLLLIPASHSKAATTSYLGLTGLGMPTAPQPFSQNAASAHFAITLHDHHTCGGSIANGFGPPVDAGTCDMQADHGPACEAPPAQHYMDGSYANMVFVCHDHLMTSLNGAGGGMITLQPDQLVDFSSGPATVSISRSTADTSNRDWLDFYFVPFTDQLAYSADGNVGEPIKEANSFIRVLQPPNNANHFVVTEQVNGMQMDVPGDSFTTLEDLGLVDSASIRTPITMTISQTHFSLSAFNHVFYDAALPMPFPATQAVFQIQHIDYDPDKDGGLPNTWHWSNLSISSAVPYYLDHPTPDAVGDYPEYGLGDTIHFAPAPAGSYLRFQVYNMDFSGFTPGYDISFDGGTTWTPWAYQTPQDSQLGSVLQPVPAGVTSAILRGASGWYARDFYVLSLGGTVPVPTPTTPALPTPTAIVPTPTTVPTSTTLNNTPCMVTINGVMTSGFCTGSFLP